MAEPLKVLDALGDELERIALADERGSRWHAARRHRPRRRTALLSLLVATVVSGVAIAASGLLEQGDPVRPPLWTTMNPQAGYGVPIERTARLTEIRVVDPDGGPPWGLRTVTTTRGFGCVQVGRVVDGQLGVLGTDGAFGDDRRFHPLPTGQLAQAHCERPDDAGQTFIAISARGVPASGYQGGCWWRGSTSAPPGAATCGRARMRVLYFGLLGPKARAVTYRDDRDEIAVTPTAGREGAYLVVVRPDARRPASGGWVPTSSPGSGLTSVEYDGAPTCRIRSPRSIGGAKLCPMVGRVDRPLGKVTTADVASPILVRRGGEFITLTFTARVPSSRRRMYLAETRETEGGARCRGSAVLSPVVEDVRAGQQVTIRVGVNGVCRGAKAGRIVLASSRPGESIGMMSPMPGDPLVGRFRVPPAPR